MSDEIERLEAEFAQASEGTYEAVKDGPAYDGVWVGEDWEVADCSHTNGEADARAIVLAHNLMPAFIELAKAVHEYEVGGHQREDWYRLHCSHESLEAAIRQELGES